MGAGLLIPYIGTIDLDLQACAEQNILREIKHFTGDETFNLDLLQTGEGVRVCVGDSSIL